MARSLSLASTALCQVWCGNLADAERSIAAASESLSPSTTWLHAFVQWCSAELAWKQEKWEAVESALDGMRKTALLVEHEQLARRAGLLLAQVLELQGKHEAAIREHRNLWGRTHRTVRDGMATRESLVRWKMGARQSEWHLQQALVTSRQLERWSLEDALTGIANRRHFEHTVASAKIAAKETGVALSLAMIDVDHFKGVNDQFGHSVGDQVLKVVASILSSHVRGSDLAARWAGDEFVILFVGADEGLATVICERIDAAVSDFDWYSVAPGLRLSISVGCGRLWPHDELEVALHRSDELMYAAKNRGID